MQLNEGRYVFSTKDFSDIDNLLSKELPLFFNTKKNIIGSAKVLKIKPMFLHLLVKKKIEIPYDYLNVNLLTKNKQTIGFIIKG